MVLTLAYRPYTIVQVNERWENLTGHKGVEVVGKQSCSILQGADTAQKELDQLMGPVLFKRPSCAMLTNYTKSGRRYRNYITIYPLSTDSNISHYFGLTTFVQWIDADDPTQHRDRDRCVSGYGNSTCSSVSEATSYDTKSSGLHKRSCENPRNTNGNGVGEGPAGAECPPPVNRAKINDDFSSSSDDPSCSANANLIVFKFSHELY